MSKVALKCNPKTHKVVYGDQGPEVIRLKKETKRLERLVAELDSRKQYTVTRSVIATRASEEHNTPRSFEVQSFTFVANNGADASDYADRLKFNRERELGHHTTVR